MKTMSLQRAIGLPLVTIVLALSPPLAGKGLAWHFEFSGVRPNKIVWVGEAAQSYDLWFSENLLEWTRVAGYPQQGTGSRMEHSFTPGRRGFFRITSAAATPEGFVLIPAGNFEMGDSLDGWTSELPVHTVYVSAFSMARLEVTKALWDEVRNWGMSHGYTDLSAGDGKGPDHPVHSISWYEAVKWCNARSEKERLRPCYQVSEVVYRTGTSDAVTCSWQLNGYRLPTEAEWEKAARGGLIGRRFPFGESINHNRANYFSQLGRDSYDLSRNWGFHPSYDFGALPYTSPVGSFARNGYGLYDMAGNVWEWCWDWFDEGYYMMSPGTDPPGPASGSRRVLRGGSWSDLARYARCAFRLGDVPEWESHFRGLRLARGQ